MLLPSKAFAFALSTSVEAMIIPSVGGAFQTVTFENSYSAAVPVCTYNLPNNSAPPAVVRIQSITSTGMQIKLQRPRSSASVTAGSVYCFIAETGVSTLPDGRRIEARTTNAPNTHGRNVPLGFGNASVATMSNISGLFSGFTNPIALGQVISYNDANFSAFHANDCEVRTNPPFAGGFGDGICVTKHVGEDNTTRSAETLGVIVIESGTGSYDGIEYQVALGGDTIDGVQNAGNSYSVLSGVEFVAGTQSAEDGGDGGFAVLLGTGTVGGSSVTFAIDEDQLNDAERSHTTEQVAFFAARRLPLFTAEKEVDWASIAQTLTLNYTITLENTGELDQTGVVVTDLLPNGSSGTVSGPTESITTDGVFEAGETFTYTISYPVSPAEIAAGLPLTNNVSATTDQYATESLSDETDSAVTIIELPSPSLDIEKTASPTSDVGVGDLINYTYVVTNNGNQFITGISITDVHNGSDPAPTPSSEALTTDNLVIGDSTDAIANDGVWDTLAPGDVVTFTGTYTVTQTDVDTLQ